MKIFIVNDETPCTLKSLIESNFDQPELIAWAKNAKHGEKFGGGAGGSAECIDSETAIACTLDNTHCPDDDYRAQATLRQVIRRFSQQ